MGKTKSSPTIITFKISPEVKKLYKETVEKYGIRSQYFIEQAIIHEAKYIEDMHIYSEYRRAITESGKAVDFEKVAAKFGIAGRYPLKRKRGVK